MTIHLSSEVLLLKFSNALTDPNDPKYACIHELMKAVDEYIPTPARPTDLPFLMPVEDVF